MERGRPLRKRLFSSGWGITAPALCTALAWPLRDVLAPASILMLYLLGVLLVATRAGRWPGTLASLVSAPAFAFFFAPPIFSMAMKDLENTIGLAVMLIVAHVTSGLLEAMRRQADLAARREARAGILYRLSEALSGAQSEDEVVRIAVRRVFEELALRSVLLLSDPQGRVAYPKAPPLPESLRHCDLGQAQRVLATAGDGPPEPDGPATLIPLPDASGPLGVLALGADAGRAGDEPEQGAFLAMLSQQLAQSLKRVRLAGEARKAYVQAEAESLRNSLLSAISHDLRTPLTRIMGTASALAEPNESLSPVERYELAGEIRDEARHMADLMSKILDMARLTAGTLVLQREWNALEEIVGSALNRLDALLRGRPVRVELPEHLPLIRVDAVLLQQVLVNLVENAAKYSLPGSSIDIAAQCAPAALRIVVADRGQGVPAEFRGRLFEKFYRGVPESAQSGVGLGLALCRAIMEAHGGGIGVEPRPGGGSLFLLTLPLEEQPPGLDFEDPLEAAP